MSSRPPSRLAFPSERSQSPASSSSQRRKAFHIDVVLEGNAASDGNDKLHAQQSQIITQFLKCCGKVIKPLTSSPYYNAQDINSNSPRASPTRPRSYSTNNAEILGTRFTELMDTERAYLKRIKVLYLEYAVFLQKMLSDSSMKLSKYDHKQLFGNIKQIVDANERFLKDLEHCQTTSGVLWGQVMARHLELFAPIYGSYLTGFDKAKEIESTLSRERLFGKTIAEIKARTTSLGIGNVGLRELLMEPVQRIPRYDMILKGMLLHMSERDPNHRYVVDSIAMASRIASCESDEETRRAATMWGLKQAMQDFPDVLVSHQRFFIDAIDVEDLPVDAHKPLSLSTSRSGAFSDKSLFCTLFLFSDCLVIAKRLRHTVNGRACTGLEDIESLVSLMNASSTASVTSSPSKLKSRLKKGLLSFRGCVKLNDFTGADLGSEGFALHFERALGGTSEKTADRSLRHFVVTPTADSASTPKAEKNRFMEHLWRVQSQYKCDRPCPTSDASTLMMTEYSKIVSCAEERPAAHCNNADILLYFNITRRIAYEEQQIKKRHVLHFDLTGAAETIEFTDFGNPHAISRITPCLNGTFVASTEFRAAAASSSTGQGVPLPVALMRIVEALNDLGLFNVPPQIPGYRQEPAKSIIPARIRSPSLFGSGSSLNRNGTISSIFSNSTNASHKRSNTVRSAVSVAESKVSSLFSTDRLSTTTTTSVYSNKDDSSSSPVVIPRNNVHSEVNGDRSRVYLTKSPSTHQPWMSRSTSNKSLDNSRNFGSQGSIMQIVEDQEEPTNFPVQKDGQALRQSQSHDEMDSSKLRNKRLIIDEQDRAASLPPNFSSDVSASRPASPSFHMRGPRQLSSPRRPLPEIDNVFLNDSSVDQSFNQDSNSPSSSSYSGQKRPLDKDQSPFASKKAALQSRALPSPVKQSSRRVSSGRSRKIPLTATEASLSSTTTATLDVHGNVKISRTDIHQLRSEIKTMRQKVMVDIDADNFTMPRSPQLGNLKAVGNLPANLEGWMQDIEDRLEVLSTKYIAIESQLARPFTSSAGTQTDRSPGLSASIPSDDTKFLLQIAALVGERTLLKQQVEQLNLEINTAFEQMNEELDQAYAEAQLGHPEFTNAIKNDLRQNKAARYAAMVDNDRLKREIEVKDSRLEEYERILLAHGLLAQIT